MTRARGNLPTALDVLLYVTDHPDSTKTDVIGALIGDCNPGSVQTYVERGLASCVELDLLGITGHRGAGGANVYNATDNGRRFIEEFFEPEEDGSTLDATDEAPKMFDSQMHGRVNDP